MCSIIGSFDIEILKRLILLNQHRGNFSYSITGINKSETKREFGELDPNSLSGMDGNDYYLCHVQAPTGGLIKDENRIHPVKHEDSLLWHNGILTDSGIKRLQVETESTETFDTYLMVKALDKYGLDILNDIEGLFSCVWKNKDGKYLVFRTKHGKLYVDENLSISSERFEGSKCINFDTVYEIDWENRVLKPIANFKTRMFNFIIKGEM